MHNNFLRKKYCLTSQHPIFMGDFLEAMSTVLLLMKVFPHPWFYDVYLLAIETEMWKAV